MTQQIGSLPLTQNGGGKFSTSFQDELAPGSGTPRVTSFVNRTNGRVSNDYLDLWDRRDRPPAQELAKPKGREESQRVEQN